jgi:hypothetical protein
VDDIRHALPIEERQRVDEDEAGDPLTRQFRGSAQDHAAGAGAGQHDFAQIFIEDQLGDLDGMRFDGDAGPQLMPALGATVQ